MIRISKAEVGVQYYVWVVLDDGDSPRELVVDNIGNFFGTGKGEMLATETDTLRRPVIGVNIYRVPIMLTAEGEWE